MIDIVYQYVNGAAAWEEIRYSLRSVDKYFKDECRVWFVGEKPDWAINVELIPIDRKYDDFFTNCLDACRKMNAVILHPEITDDFIYMYDDVYFLKETTAKQVDKWYHLPKGTLGEEKIRAMAKKSKHLKLKLRTIDALRANPDFDKKIYDTETHLPHLFNKKKMIEVFETYVPGKNRLLFNTLYFNHHRHRRPIELRKDDTVKAEFYGPAEAEFLGFPSRDTGEVLEVFKKKRFLNHNNMAIHKAFTDAVRQWFPEKSRFER